MSDYDSAPEAGPNKASYRRILAATSILGGAAAINMLIGLGRAKVVALMLGPAGVGIMGMYMSVTGLVTAFAFAGMSGSAVREIAASKGSGDEALAKATMHTFKQLVLWLGMIATFGLAVFCQQASHFAFDDTEHALGIAILSLTVAAGVGGSYYATLLQAAGNVGRTAKLNIYTSLASAIVAVVCFVLWKRDGIVPSLLFGALVSWGQSWWMARDVNLPSPDQHTRFSWPIAKRLLTLGGFLVVIGLMLNLVNFWVRKILITDLGEEAAGMFQSAASLSLLFASYILGAMGTDFLPRVSSVAHDHEAMNRLINEQTSVAMLLGLPGVLATILFAPIVIPVLYSREFGAAVPVLQLLAIGVFGRLLLWPLGFALIAKNKVTMCLSNEVFSHVVNLGVLVALIPICGVDAAGYASIAVYVACPFVLYAMIGKVTGLRWSGQVWQVLALGVVMITATLLADWWAPSPMKWIIGGVILALSAWYSMTKLTSGAEVTSAGVVRKLRSLFGRSPKVT